MAIRGVYGYSFFLELDAEFKGEAVIGIVLKVWVVWFVIQMLDGVFAIGADNNVGALQAVTQRCIHGQFVCQSNSASQ